MRSYIHWFTKGNSSSELYYKKPKHGNKSKEDGNAPGVIADSDALNICKKWRIEAFLGGQASRLYRVMLHGNRRSALRCLWNVTSSSDAVTISVQAV